MMRCMLVPVAGFMLLMSSASAVQGEKVKKDTEVAGKSDITKPEIIEKVDPKYPEEARKEGVTGKVIVDALIGTDGRVMEVKAVNDADSRLAQAAVDAVKQWKFKPGEKNGKPVKVKTSVTLNFQLK